MKVQLASAYILHARSYRDTSQLVDAITPDHGRITIVARGSRGKSGRSALLQPFRPLLLSWSGRGEMGTLTGAESAGPAIPLVGEALLSGFYLNELLQRLVARADPYPELFACYDTAIRQIGNDNERVSALRLFEKRLLDNLGYGHSWSATSNGLPIDPERCYAYQRDIGLVESSRGTLGAALLALDVENLEDSAHRVAVRPLLKGVLDDLLGPKPLNSRALLMAYRQSNKPH